MTIIPRDIGTYTVLSRQDDTDGYVVDVNELTCTCDGFMKYKTASAENPCAHLEETLVVHHRALRLYKQLHP